MSLPEQTCPLLPTLTKILIDFQIWASSIAYEQNKKAYKSGYKEGE